MYRRITHFYYLRKCINNIPIINPIIYSSGMPKNVLFLRIIVRLTGNGITGPSDIFKTGRNGSTQYSNIIFYLYRIKIKIKKKDFFLL